MRMGAVSVQTAIIDSTCFLYFGAAKRRRYSSERVSGVPKWVVERLEMGNRAELDCVLFLENWPNDVHDN